MSSEICLILPNFDCDYTLSIRRESLCRKKKVGREKVVFFLLPFHTGRQMNRMRGRGRNKIVFITVFSRMGIKRSLIVFTILKRNRIKFGLQKKSEYFQRNFKISNYIIF